MDGNKVVLWLLSAAVIVMASVFGLNALSVKDPLAKYAWKDFGYDPSGVPPYSVRDRSVKSGENPPKVLHLRISVAPETPPPAIRNAVLDAVRTVTLGDKTLDASVVLADFDDDPAKGADYSALKAVWGPGGEVAAQSSTAYTVNFTPQAKLRVKPKAAKPSAPKNPLQSPDGTVGFEFGGGG